MAENSLVLLNDFFERDVCRRATAPLGNGVEISIVVEGDDPLTLRKKNGKISLTPGTSEKPQMTFSVPRKALEELVGNPTEDIGEIGVAILKLMAASEPQRRLGAKVHIGVFDLLRYGYLSVLPLGGPSVMKFLSTKGLGGMGKIKDAISRMRG